MSSEDHSDFSGGNPMHRNVTASNATSRDEEEYFDAIMSPPDRDERYLMRVEREGTFSKHYRCYLERVESPRSVSRVAPFEGKLLFTAEKLKTSLKANYHVYLMVNEERYGDSYWAKVRVVQLVPGQAQGRERGTACAPHSRSVVMRPRGAGRGRGGSLGAGALR